MTTVQIKGSPVTRPAVTPFGSSVLDHATVVENAANFGLRSDAGLWPSYNCLDTLVPTPICPDPLFEKTFSEGGWVPGFTFALHGGVQCKTVGLDVEDMKREIARVFKLNEGKGVEQALLGNRFVATDSDSVDYLGEASSWPDATDLTPAGDISLATALALLEGYARRVYAGVPTLHLPAAAASLLGSDKIVWEGGKAFTRLGSKVAMGGGYDPESIETGTWDGTFDLYATGEVYVEMSEQVDVQVYQLTGIGSDTDSNTAMALGERMFRVGVDCFVAKATGTV